ncbi:MAG: MtrB/PioB family outer membrane beta-barrel protein, partial [Bacteroidales bacterium]
IEWASHQGMMRVSYDYSKFNQNIPYLDWDNPQRATDFCKTGISGQAPGTCYDPSGYSNGNGPADGRMAMPPTNTLNTFAFLGMVKLPNHTTANASFQMGANNQDAALIPWTTNPVIANQTVYNTFPGLASLPRDTAQMAVNYATATMNVNSRVNKYLNVAARYRYNSRNDFTRGFDAVEYVRFDAVPEETGGETEPFHINRNTFDVNASVTPFRYGAIRFGYGYDKWQHTVRATEAWRDNTYRISYDGVVNQYVTLRLLYENINRESQNLHVGDITDAGGQDALRFYDEASRDRNRATFIVEVNPLPMLGINFTAATAKDDYQGADPSQQFGLLDNKNDAFTIGFNVAPNAMVNFGMDYGRETYHSLQQSRNANPAPDPSWTDPNRNWTLTNDEHVNNFQLYANLVNALPKTDIRVGYDFSDSDQAFVHGGPRIATLQTLNTFVALPNVTNSWNRFTVDAKHDINKKLGVGFTYWYEKFDVKDFATINSAGPQTLPVAALGTQTDQPRVDWLGGLVTGYGNRPYTGQTGFVRVYYMF